MLETILRLLSAAASVVPRVGELISSSSKSDNAAMDAAKTSKPKAALDADELARDQARRERLKKE